MSIFVCPPKIKTLIDANKWVLTYVEQVKIDEIVDIWKNETEILF